MTQDVLLVADRSPTATCLEDSPRLPQMIQRLSSSTETRWSQSQVLTGQWYTMSRPREVPLTGNTSWRAELHQSWLELQVALRVVVHLTMTILLGQLQLLDLIITIP
jgi:hypothetical protein